MIGKACLCLCMIVAVFANNLAYAAETDSVVVNQNDAKVTTNGSVLIDHKFAFFQRPILPSISTYQRYFLFGEGTSSSSFSEFPYCGQFFNFGLESLFDDFTQRDSGLYTSDKPSEMLASGEVAQSVDAATNVAQKVGGYSQGSIPVVNLDGTINYELFRKDGLVPFIHSSENNFVSETIPFGGYIADHDISGVVVGLDEDPVNITVSQVGGNSNNRDTVGIGTAVTPVFYERIYIREFGNDGPPLQIVWPFSSGIQEGDVILGAKYSGTVYLSPMSFVDDFISMNHDRGYRMINREGIQTGNGLFTGEFVPVQQVKINISPRDTKDILSYLPKSN